MSRRNVMVAGSALETGEYGRVLGERFTGGELVTVMGILGAGKTTLIRGLALGLGIERGVCSPTYTLVNEYRGGRLVLYHVDLYRLTGSGDVDDLGLEECLEYGVVAVEWPEIGAHFWHGYRPRIDVRIDVLKDGARRITVEESV